MTSAGSSVGKIARAYLRRGWAPIPVPFRSKNPNLPGWQHLRLSEADLAVHFDGRPQNVGLLLGAPSGGLVDVDHDAPEARAVADAFLPPTPCIFGCFATPHAHRFYVPDAVLTTRMFRDPTARPDDARAMLVELRATGTQTLVPPSVHPSGEPITWAAEGEPASVTSTELTDAVACLAAAALLARYWPAPAGRHEAALALAGGLLHGGWAVEDTADFMTAVAFAAGDEELTDRARAADSTRRAMAGDRRTAGWPTLARLLDPRVVDAVRDWFGVRPAPQGAKQHGSAPDDPPWDAPTPLPDGAPRLPDRRPAAGGPRLRGRARPGHPDPRGRCRAAVSGRRCRGGRQARGRACPGWLAGTGQPLRRRRAGSGQPQECRLRRVRQTLRGF